MNDINSAKNYLLSFYLDIPIELCQYYEEDEEDLECTPDVKYNVALKNKWIAILSNRKRFESDSYDG